MSVDFDPTELAENASPVIRILLVEDDHQNSDQLLTAFREISQCQIDLVVRQLPEALLHLQSNQTEVVLLDFRSLESGIDQLTLLRALTPDVPIVVLTASKDDDFLLRIIKAGAQDYLMKSEIGAISLIRAVHYAIARLRSEQTRRDVALRQAENKLRTVADNLPALIAYVDADQRYQFVNQFHEEWFGLSVASLTGQTMQQVLGDEYENCRPHIDTALLGQRVMFERRILRNKCERFLQISYLPEYDAARRVSGFYVFGHDITERKLNQARLETIALFDPLTGLASRALLTDRIWQAIAHAKRHLSIMALVYLDLDGFKVVNDTFGHDAGDLLLREAAERLVATVRQEDTVARMGGDEFVIVMEKLATADYAARVVAKLITVVSQPYCIRGHTVNVTTSAGVSFYPAQGKDMEALMKSADRAMYEAKRAGKNTYRIAD